MLYISYGIHRRKRLNEAYNYCDAVLAQPRTKGGLWYDDGLSVWASNRYAANAACIVATFANFLTESDEKRKKYIDFVKSQIDYILGDNPAGVNYVVGAEDNSPKYITEVLKEFLILHIKEQNLILMYILYMELYQEALEYIDDRSNYQMNEVALDYNAGFTMCLTALVQFGLNVEDKGERA